MSKQQLAAMLDIELLDLLRREMANGSRKRTRIELIARDAYDTNDLDIAEFWPIMQLAKSLAWS